MNIGKPLVYSCSGCSNAAQIANHLALRLTRDRIAEMSCIAGVGGQIKSLVNTAKSGRPVIAIDGCALHCTRACLHAVGVVPAMTVNLSDWGIKKKLHEDFSAAEAEVAYARLKDEIKDKIP